MSHLDPSRRRPRSAAPTGGAPSRRRFLAGGAALAGTFSAFAGRAQAGLAPRIGLLPWLGPEDGANDHTLVVVQLAGGNDGLNTVVPHGDDLYYKSRSGQRIEAADVLPLDEYRGFNPTWKDVAGFWEKGQLAIVEGVGYPQPNRSHFTSFDIWHAADTRGRAGGDGWLTRLGGRLLEGREYDSQTAIHVGSRLPYSMTSAEHPSLCFPDPERYQWDRNEEPIASVARPEEESMVSSAVDRLRETVQQAKATSAAIRNAAADYRPRVEYPGDGLGAAMRTAAALLRQNIGARIVSVELPGFDTHVRQAATHTRLLTSVNAALAAFEADLRGTPEGERNVTLVFSEFGRRVADNASGGTDHGTAGPVFLMGPAVQGGLYGQHSSLSELDEGDLIFTTDFRSVYATVIEDWFGVPSTDVLNTAHPTLPLLRS